MSEALYLSDPEGNGIEIYADRPAAGWRWRGGEVGMDTLPLDFASLAAAVEGPWRGAPAGTTVGHVHLQVGNLRDAEAFYAGQLGLDITSRMPGALFYSADGYHHHLATNIWNSRAAGPRDLPSTGLAEVVLSVQAERLAGLGGAAVLEDPAAIRESLLRQVTGGVRWTQSVERLAGLGIEAFVEVGSGKVLSGLARRIAKDIPVYTTESAEAIKKVLAELAP